MLRSARIRASTGTAVTRECYAEHNYERWSWCAATQYEISGPYNQSRAQQASTKREVGVRDSDTENWT